MSLLQLSNELLVAIAQHLPSERDISAFSRTNRELHKHLDGYLYRHNVLHHQRSALIWASKHGQVGTAGKSIAQGANINSLNEDEDSPFYLAASNGHAWMVKLLFDHGAEIKKRGGERQGMPPSTSSGVERVETWAELALLEALMETDWDMA
jgi:ankyrin repeat protein